MLGTRHMPLYKIECNIAMGFFLWWYFTNLPKNIKRFIGYSVKMAPTILTEEKQNLYQTCLFQISRIRKSLKLGRNMRSYVEWCMFTYLDIAWNYKVTKINQLINQNRRTPSIRHQSGLNLLLVFSMPLDVFPLSISLQRNMHPHFVSRC